MQTRKTPMRMCTGCGEMKPKKELIRIVRNKQGEIFLDVTGKAAGRGAYLCKRVSCLKKAQKTRRLERSFSCAIPDSVYQTLSEELAKDE